MVATDRLSRSRLTLRAETAQQLMRSDPVSLRADATVREAVILFAGKALSVAPVIDDAGKPIGVLSCSDILVHEREKAEARQGSAFVPDTAVARDLMTPAVFAVAPETPAAGVVAELLRLKVHHVFVVDAQGVLVGVISANDVLRGLRR
jgi:CBS domain-containing protein